MPYEKHPELIEPKLTQQLWRYMDFAKFMSLVQNKSLYFPHVSEFDTTDPWEGFPSISNYNCEKFFSELKHSNLSPNQINNMLQEYIKVAPRIRKCFYVNCWHMNDDESDSQWKIYGNNGMSLAIVSNFERMSRAITDSKTIYGSKVTYYNPEKDMTSSGNLLHHAIVKRQAFSHEREFRLIHSDPSRMQKNEVLKGISVAVKIPELIERIVISPLAPEWFVTVIHSTLKKYGLHILTSKSTLLDPVIF